MAVLMRCTESGFYCFKETELSSCTHTLCCILERYSHVFSCKDNKYKELIMPIQVNWNTGVSRHHSERAPG